MRLPDLKQKEMGITGWQNNRFDSLHSLLGIIEHRISEQQGHHTKHKKVVDLSI